MVIDGRNRADIKPGWVTPKSLRRECSKRHCWGKSPRDSLGRQALTLLSSPESESGDEQAFRRLESTLSHCSWVLFSRLLLSFCLSRNKSLSLDRGGRIGIDCSVILLGSPREDGRCPSTHEGFCSWDVTGATAHLCLYPRSGVWAIPHCQLPTGLWWVDRPRWRSPHERQAPTVCKWLQSLGLGLESPVALSASF